MASDSIIYLLSFFESYQLKISFFSADMADITVLLGIWMLINAKESRLIPTANIRDMNS